MRERKRQSSTTYTVAASQDFQDCQDYTHGTSSLRRCLRVKDREGEAHLVFQGTCSELQERGHELVKVDGYTL